MSWERRSFQETIKVDTHREMTDDVRCTMVTCDVTDTVTAAAVMDALSDNLATAQAEIKRPTQTGYQ